MTHHRKRIKSLSLLSLAVFVTVLLLRNDLHRLNEDILAIEPNVLASGLLLASKENGGTLRPLEDSFSEGESWTQPDGLLLDILHQKDPEPTYRFGGIFLLPNGEPIEYERVVDSERDALALPVESRLKKDFAIADQDIVFEVFEVGSPIDKSITHLVLLANAKPIYAGYGNLTTTKGWYLVDSESFLFKTRDNLRFEVNQRTERWLGVSTSAAIAYLGLRLKKDRHTTKVPVINANLDSTTAILSAMILMIYISILFLHSSLGIVRESRSNSEEPWLFLSPNNSTYFYSVLSVFTTLVGAVSLVISISLPFLGVFLLLGVTESEMVSKMLWFAAMVSLFCAGVALYTVAKWRLRAEQEIKVIAEQAPPPDAHKRAGDE